MSPAGLVATKPMPCAKYPLCAVREPLMFQGKSGQNDGSGVADADSASRPKPQTPSLSVTEWGHFKLWRRGQLKLSFPCVATNGG